MLNHLVFFNDIKLALVVLRENCLSRWFSYNFDITVKAASFDLWFMALNKIRDGF